MANDTPRDQFGLVGTRLDDYDVDRVVAAGGFGVVYFARHRALAQPVAIKVLKVPDSLHGEGRATFLKLFLDEAKTIAALKHPAIVGVLGYRVSPMPAGGDAPWMALEWVEGETLAAQLSRRQGQGGRDPRECLRLLEPVFDALAVAHARGIAHRDIKPANLMLPTAGTTGRFGVLTRVLDFGIAKGMEADARAGSGQTATSSPFQAFSMPYASFEQVSGTRTGPWTDVHALALILVEMLTDQSPFKQGDRGAQLMEVMSPTRPTPARFGVDVGPWESVLARALALKPGDRFPNAGEFLAALEANVPTTVWRGLVGEQSSAFEDETRRDRPKPAAPTVAMVGPVPLAYEPPMNTASPLVRPTASTTVAARRSRGLIAALGVAAFALVGIVGIAVYLAGSASSELSPPASATAPLAQAPLQPAVAQRPALVPHAPPALAPSGARGGPPGHDGPPSVPAPHRIRIRVVAAGFPSHTSITFQYVDATPGSPPIPPCPDARDCVREVLANVALLVNAQHRRSTGSELVTPTRDGQEVRVAPQVPPCGQIDPNTGLIQICFDR